MSMKVSSWAWVLALCCFCFSSKALANYNNFTFGHDVDYALGALVDIDGYTVTDWQWFPGSGERDGNTTNDSFCLITDTGQGYYEAWYGVNGQQSCEWWSGLRTQYSDIVYKDFYADYGGVTIDCSNPLNDPSCSGYEQAYLGLMCSANPLYDQSCPGYATAYFDVQCNANPLYDQNCTGYAEAYLEQQCTADALYDANCPGYQQAYALKMLEEDRSKETAKADDGSDDGVPANDGSDIDKFIEPEKIAETYEEPKIETGMTEAEKTGSGLNEDEKFVQELATKPEETIVIQQEEQNIVVVEEVQVVKEEPTQQETVAAVKEEPAQQDALEEANSLDLDSMSPSEVISALSNLGILGNDQTNGVGDPSGLSGGIEGTGGTISATGQVALPGLTPDNSGNSQSSYGGSSSSDIASGGSYSPAGTPNAQTGTAGNTLTLDSNSTSDPAVQSAEDIASGSADPSGTFNMSVPGVDTIPGLGGPGFGTVNSTYETTSSGVTDLEQEMGVNVNPLFTDPALSAGAIEMAGIQEERYETQTQRIIKERIGIMVEAKQAEQDTSNKDAEKLVAESIQDSIDEKLQELQVNPDQNQAEIVALMGANVEFNEYNDVKLPDAFMPDKEDWYKEFEIPQNRSALRNGLAQQILHEKMVDMQYPEENE
jgi:hypothetical protein